MLDLQEIVNDKVCSMVDNGSIQTAIETAITGLNEFEAFTCNLQLKD